MSLNVSYPINSRFWISEAKELFIANHYGNGRTYIFDVDRTNQELHQFVKNASKGIQWSLAFESISPFRGVKSGIDLTFFSSSTDLQSLKSTSCDLFCEFADYIPGVEDLTLSRLSFNRVRLLFKEDQGFLSEMLETLHKMNHYFANNVVKQSLQRNGDIRFLLPRRLPYRNWSLVEFPSHREVQQSSKNRSPPSSSLHYYRRIVDLTQQNWESGTPGLI
jgi:hypothetical protein